MPWTSTFSPKSHNGLRAGLRESEEFLVDIFQISLIRVQNAGHTLLSSREEIYSSGELTISVAERTEERKWTAERDGTERNVRRCESRRRRVEMTARRFFDVMRKEC